jgi:hypothetical protein
MNMKKTVWLVVLAFAVLVVPVTKCQTPNHPASAASFDGTSPLPPWR